MRWPVVLLLLLPLAGAQVPSVGAVEQPHVTLWEDGLVLHFAVTGAALTPAESPVVRYSVNGGAQQEVAAPEVGHVRLSATFGEAGGTRVYAAKVQVSPGDVVVYSGGTASRGFTADATVAMPPTHTLRFAAAGDIGYTGVAADGSDNGQVPGGARPIVVRDLIMAQRPDLMVIPGDLAYDNSLVGWDRFMRMYAPLQSTIPTMASIGNHEWSDSQSIGYGQFLAEYVLPGDEHDYLFRSGPVTFIAINSDNVCAGDTSRTSYGHEADPCPYGHVDTAKLARIEALLQEAAADDTPWTVAFMHHPPYSWGRHNSDFGVRALLAPLFDKHGVDFVITAHDHLYSRTFPVLADETVRQTGDEYVAGDGIVYIVVGGGGRPLYAVRYPDEPVPAWHAAGGEFFHAMVADVDNETMRIQVLAVNGTVMDAFTISKKASQNVEPQDAGAPGLLVPTLLVGLLALGRRMRR